MWIVLLIIILIILIFVVSIYNKLVRLRNSVKDQWSQIDVQLKRRFDLIPNLVETVKGYTKHEKDTLEEVVNLRNKFQKSNTVDEAIDISKELNNSLSKVIALAEGYPELKSNENYIDLQKQLADTEDKVAYARQFYSDSVLKYNTAIQVFPSNIIATIFGFSEEKFFTADDAERVDVKVDLSVDKK